MRKTAKIKMYQNRLMAILLVLSLIIGLLPAGVSVSADEPVSNDTIYPGLIYNYEGTGYGVEIMITDAWQGACNARIVIRNTGAEVIDNWALTFTMGCDITNIWNAVVVDKESFLSGDGTDLFSYTIKNDHHNKDIPIGGQIELGMSLSIPANSGSFVLPDTYNMAQKEVDVPGDDYVFSALIYGETNYNYNGVFTLRNISETVIEDWSLEFTTDIDVIDFHTADLIERQGNHYIKKIETIILR